MGASLAMETIPPKARGLVSGILQAGYPSGYLVASVVYGLLYQAIGWRGMFMIGIAPAALVFFIFRNVRESPSWTPKPALGADALRHAFWPMAGWCFMAGRLFRFRVWRAGRNLRDRRWRLFRNGISFPCSDLRHLSIAALASSLWLALRYPDHWIEFFAVLGMIFIDFFTFAVPGNSAADGDYLQHRRRARRCIPENALADRALFRADDDRVQLLQSRHPGSLSDLPAGTAAFLACDRQHTCRRL